MRSTKFKQSFRKNKSLRKKQNFQYGGSSRAQRRKQMADLQKAEAKANTLVPPLYGGSQV